MHDNLNLFIKNIGKLKRKDRTGWVLAGIEHPETVDQHCFRVGLIAYILAPRFNYDPDKCLKMGLFHDIAEYKVPDYTLYDGISKEKKRQQEEEAMRELCDGLKGGEAIFNIWSEYENQKTPEAKFVKAIDKLEMYFQATEYEEEQPKVDLEVFWQNSKLYDFDVVKDIFKTLEKRRKGK